MLCAETDGWIPLESESRFCPLMSPLSVSLKQVSQQESICEQRNQIQEEP